MKALVELYKKIGLVPLIIIGLIVGTIIGATMPSLGMNLAILGTLFVGALKAVAPILVFILVTSAISQHNPDSPVFVKPVIILYLFGTFFAALTAVLASFAFPTELTLITKNIEQVPPASLNEVISNLLMNLVANPINALANANYIGILAWALLIGFALRQASEQTRNVIDDCAEAVSQVVKWVIALAPFGIMGLVANTVAETGFEALMGYARILGVLVGCMLFSQELPLSLLVVQPLTFL